MSVQKMPRADLEHRPGDWQLTNEQVLRLSLFAGLKRKPNLDRFPGAVMVRTYQPGETICWQGEGGGTAFYALTTEDVLALRQEELARGDGDRLRLADEIGRLRRRQEEVGPGEQEAWRLVGVVHVATPSGERNSMRRLTQLARASGRAVPGTSVHGLDMGTLYVPVDGPATLSYDTMKGPLCEGELFCETSCMYRTPRPGTVVATRECFVLEILRNILDQMYKDPAFREMADLTHQRQEAVGWRNLSLFADLSDAEYEALCSELRVVRAEPGAVICDEHEPDDAIYIVRNGLVRVARNASALLGEDDVRDWARLWAGLRTSGAVRLRELLGVREGAGGAGVVRALNGVLARADLLDDPALGLTVRARSVSDGLAEPVAYAPGSDVGKELEAALARRNDARKRGRAWPEKEARRCHRLLLEAMAPGAIRPVTEQGGLETTIGYRGPGEWFGEQAELDDGAPPVTCTAVGHPGEEGMVELVRVPAEVFGRMLDASPKVWRRVEKEARRRLGEAERRMRGPLWADAEPVQASRAFEELGLIQGQELMVIDLERCTRCNECVKACVDTHTDGLARIALDGPRFGKYLVPMTCRSCLDPVCLIGCPVGSIHRGDSRQIVIEDWCIGCGLCAEKCPYGSIQMQDLGVIGESAAWRFAPVEVVTEGGWAGRTFKDLRWPVTEAPVRYDRELYEALAGMRGRGGWRAEAGHVLFRHVFQLMPSADGVRYRLELTTRAAGASVIVNGMPAEPEETKRQGRATFHLAKGGDGPGLRAGVNVIAVAVPLPGRAPTGELLLAARLDEVRRPRVPAGLPEDLAEEVNEKQVTHRAATCDLCSGVPGQGPACVRVCPHDAALRIDGRGDFPR